MAQRGVVRPGYAWLSLGTAGRGKAWLGKGPDGQLR